MADKNNNELINHSRKKKRSSLPIVLIISLVIGLLVGTISFFLAYRYMISDSVDEIDTDRFSANDMADQVQANLIGSDIDAVVREINTDNKSISFYNIKNETSLTVNVTDNTTFPAGVTFDTLKVGDIFTYVFNEDKALVELKECSEAWEIEDVGLTVNAEAKILTFSDTAQNHPGKSYKYIDELTTVRFKNEYSSMSKISPVDYVALRGYDNGRINRVYSITILKSHGELQLQNINAIDNLEIEINGTVHTPDPDDPRIILTEGTYDIKISGDNCEEVTRNIVIEPDNPYVLDLSKINVKSGILKISSNVSDCKIYINNKEYSMSETPLLEYGTYEVRATKEGYNDAVQNIEIDEDENLCYLSLEKINKNGTITITVSPENASICIDDVYQGTGTVTKELPLGTYIVSASADGYETDRKQVNITVDGQEIPVSFQLNQQ